MCPAFGLNMATRHFLQSIVSNRRRGAEPVFEISRLDQVPLSLGMMAPHTGITIGLEFHPDRERISLHLRNLSLEAMHFFCNAEEVLHVMADFMGDDISLGEVTCRS